MFPLASNNRMMKSGSFFIEFMGCCKGVSDLSILVSVKLFEIKFRFCMFKILANSIEPPECAS